jgi:hypothetical protein
MMCFLTVVSVVHLDVLPAEDQFVRAVSLGISCMFRLKRFFVEGKVLCLLVMINTVFGMEFVWSLSLKTYK